MHAIQPIRLDDLGLEAALRYLGEESERSLGLKAPVAMDRLLPYGESFVETVRYHLAQEAVTHFVRFAQGKVIV